jgi:hypothetical protein
MAALWRYPTTVYTGFLVISIRREKAKEGANINVLSYKLREKRKDEQMEGANLVT